MKMSTKRYTKKDVKIEILKLKRRLKTFSSHTPTLTYDINEDYIMSLSRKEAVETLKSIKWSNVGKMKKKAYKAINITAIGKAPRTRTKTVTAIPNTKKQDLLTTLKSREKTTGKPFAINIASESSIDSAIDFANYFEKEAEKAGQSAKEYYNEWLQARDAQAMTNFKNNITLSGGYSDDPTMKAVSELILELINSGRLTLEEIRNSGLNEVAGLNLFASIDDATLKANAEAILDELRIAIPITDEEIEKMLQDKGFVQEVINELLGK